MNVIVQNGCRHILTRSDLESALAALPVSWLHDIQSVTLYQGQEPKIYVTYHKKERALGLYCPEHPEGLNRTAAVEELFIALACIKDRGDLPNRLSKTVRGAYQAEARKAMRSLQ
jgi:hypothetical protein